MEKYKFKEIIAITSNLIMENNGVCSALDSASFSVDGPSFDISCDITFAFRYLLQPKDILGRKITGVDGNNMYWLGDRVSKNKEIRLTFLAMFEAIILESERYEEW